MAQSSEDGLTLIELLVYMMLSVVVLGVVGSLMINSITTEKDVRSITSATNQAQVAADSISTGIRNSSDLTVTTIGSDKLLMARTASSADAVAWQCMSWYFSAADKSIRYRLSNSQIPIPSVDVAKTWTLLASGVVTTGADPVFVEAEPGSLTFSFSSTTAGNAPVSLRSTAISRVDTFVSTPCF